MEKIINENYNNLEEEKSSFYKGVVIGGSGAVGRELVLELIASENWIEIVVITRRVLEEWENFKDVKKLKIVEVDSLDSLEQSKKWKFENFNTVFCCLGSRTKIGKEKFYKVDYTYIYNSGILAKNNSIPHFSLVSCGGADSKSIFYYFEIKGKAENILKELKLNVLSIFRPGLINKRRNDTRLMENILRYIPFIPKISSIDLAKAMKVESELISKREDIKNEKEVNIYKNSIILSLTLEKKFKF